MTDSFVTVNKLSKSYDIGTEKVRALSRVSTVIRRGDFVSVMGPSGSGKSTFMNLIGCLDTPDDGEIWLDGQNVAELARDDLAKIRNTKIGFVFQQFNLLGRTTAVENVCLPLLYAGFGRRERVDRATESLDRVGLSDRLHHHPTQLSGGQQQRVAIARALVNQPTMILADEPTGALDSHTGVEIMDLFSELNKSGITVVLVTHEQTVAEYARRIIHFLDGEIVSDESMIKEVA